MTADRWNDARHWNVGEAHGKAKLSENDVVSIRIRSVYGEKHTDLAKEFGVSQGSISRIVNRVDWAHVE